MEITSITEEDIELCIVRVCKKIKLPKKLLMSMYGIINGVMSRAVRKKKIKENPCKYVELRRFYQFCFDNEVNEADRIINDEQMDALIQQIQKDKLAKPSYIPIYAVEFDILTGMRVGEIPALLWKNIDFKNKVIRIDSSEKINQKTRERYIGYTKTNKKRMIPLTEKMESFLLELIHIKEIYGYQSEYVFSDANGRINKDRISSCMRLKSKKAGIGEKSIYCIRRTVNSKIRSEGVSAKTAGAIIGNSERVNDEYYNFDTSSMSTKYMILSKVNNNMMQ